MQYRVETKDYEAYFLFFTTEKTVTALRTVVLDFFLIPKLSNIHHFIPSLLLLFTPIFLGQFMLLPINRDKLAIPPPFL